MYSPNARYCQGHPEMSPGAYRYQWEPPQFSLPELSGKTPQEQQQQQHCGHGLEERFPLGGTRDQGGRLDVGAVANSPACGTALEVRTLCWSSQFCDWLRNQLLSVGNLCSSFCLVQP